MDQKGGKKKMKQYMPGRCFFKTLKVIMPCLSADLSIKQFHIKIAKMVQV